MKKSLLFCSTALALGVTANANAMDFGNNFYGKANATIGYSLQVLDGDLKDEIDNADSFDLNTNSLTHGLTLGVGYNVYYKLNNFIHPFAGLNVEGRVPLDTKVYWHTNDGFSEKFRFTDFFAMHAKLGAKLNICKNVDLAPYYLIGFNIAKISYTGSGVDGDAETKVGLSTGVGVDTILFNRYVVGVEYKYSKNKYTNEELFDGKAEGHQIGIKLGVQFL